MKEKVGFLYPCVQRRGLSPAESSLQAGMSRFAPEQRRSTRTRGSRRRRLARYRPQECRRCYPPVSRVVPRDVNLRPFRDGDFLFSLFSAAKPARQRRQTAAGKEWSIMKEKLEALREQALHELEKACACRRTWKNSASASWAKKAP